MLFTYWLYVKSIYYTWFRKTSRYYHLLPANDVYSMPRVLNATTAEVVNNIWAGREPLQYRICEPLQRKEDLHHATNRPRWGGHEATGCYRCETLNPALGHPVAENRRKACQKVFEWPNNVGFHPTFSRHGRIETIFILLIWLNENGHKVHLLLVVLEQVFHRHLISYIHWVFITRKAVWHYPSRDIAPQTHFFMSFWGK